MKAYQGFLEDDAASIAARTPPEGGHDRARPFVRMVERAVRGAANGNSLASLFEGVAYSLTYVAQNCTAPLPPPMSPQAHAESISRARAYEVIDRLEVPGVVVQVRGHFGEDVISCGTGFVFHVDEGDAYVLTAMHILHDEGTLADHFSVCTKHNECVDAMLVYFPTSERVDEASLRIRCDYCHPLEFNPDPSNIVTSSGGNAPYELPSGIPVMSYVYSGSNWSGTHSIYGETTPHIMSEPLSEESIEHTMHLEPGDCGSPLLDISFYVIGMHLVYDDSGKSMARYLDGADPTISNILRRAIDGNQ